MSKQSALKTALVITTYNQPEFLELALETALRQKLAPYEIIVADDGSKEETERVVREAAKKSSITIKHVWQEDLGFRLDHSRNNAIAAAEADYLILIDGDCFLGDYFIHDHVRFARPGRYVAGTRGNIDRELRKKILETRCTKVAFFTKGTSKKFNLIRSLPLAMLLSRDKPEKQSETSSLATWRLGVAGANLAFFRSDAEKVNGFNELMTYHGGNDQEFCTRLDHSGVTRFKMYHYGANYHFKHDPHTHSFIPRNEVLTPTSPEYLASVDETQTRCVDAFGLTRALAQKQPPVEVEGMYQRFVF